MPTSTIPFLKKLSDALRKSYGNDLHKIALVFPNRRAGLYFRKYLIEDAAMPVWSPEIYSIEDLVQKIGRQKIGGNHQLLLLLYEVYQQIEKEKARDFDDFLNWAPVLLDDFNEIDLYLVDPVKLFSFLSEARAIALWSPEQKSLSEFQLSYLHFYRSLEQYYLNFKDALQKHQINTQGGAYRYVAENIEKLAPSISWEQIVFAGFNALSSSEERILTQLVYNKKAIIFWDCDEYYLNNPVQEAGKFLRKYRDKNELGSFQWIEQNFKNTSKTIKILGIPKQAGQTKVAGKLLSEFSGDDLNETTLVLGDENNLIPVLNSIPSSIADFNVTMGLPLRLTPLNSLIESLFQLHLKAYIKDKNIHTQSFYCKDLMTLFRHPWLSGLLDENHRNAGLNPDNYSNGLKERESHLLSRTFFTKEEVAREIIQPGIKDKYPLEFLFEDYSSRPQEIITACQTLIHYLKGHFLEDRKRKSDEINKDLEIEYLYAFSLLFSEIQQTWGNTLISLSFSSIYKLIRQSVQTIKIPFYGEPLKGLQVMGMLETRNLDFKNIILLNVNDDILPAGKKHNSFIPFDLKIQFSIPTYREKQSVFAYHFYRMIQRAENIYLLYNTEPGQIAGGDKSRFIYQLQHELPRYNQNIKISEEILSFPPLADSNSQNITIDKDDRILEKIKQQNEKGWSASALNTYRFCRLRFYFSTIEGIEASEEAVDSLDSKTLGNIFHETLESLFKPYKGKTLNDAAYTSMLDRLPLILKEVFIRKTESKDLSHGKNYLLFQVAESVLSIYLRHEKEEAEKLGKHRREYINTSLECLMSCWLGDYKLIGKADRIDQSSGSYRIIDYKSGYVDDKELRINDLKKMEKGSYDKIFQLLFYVLLCNQNYKVPASAFSPGLVSFRKPEKGFTQVKLPSGNVLSDEELSFIKGLIQNIIDEIYNPLVAFDQTADFKSCLMCPYNQICLR